MDYPQSRAQEWKVLYSELRAVLEKHGREDPFGNGDFWVVDDDYGSPQHKVCVTRVSFLTRPLALEVQRLIRKYSRSWEVLFAFDLNDSRKDPSDLGITVRKADIEERWNVERMASSFGTEFRWRPRFAAS
jgi:hypothetical protein